MTLSLKRFAFTCFSIFCFSTASFASIEVGDSIRFQNGPGKPGGEFGIADASTPTITEFITFCLEKNEYINFKNDFYVESITSSADRGGVGGGNPDPIGEQTAWLYYNFRQGTLAGYDYGSVSDSSDSRKNSANALQNAVWFLEEEQTSAGVGAAYAQLAQDEKDAFDNDANYSGNMQKAIQLVRAMNIRWNDEHGKQAQSQLYMLPDPGFGSGNGAIPEPGTLTVWATLSALGLAFGKRRRQSAKAKDKDEAGSI